MARLDIEVDLPVCQDHGQCVIAAPQAFWFDEQGRLGHVDGIDDPTDDDVAAVEEAADICPLQAILVTRR